MNTKRLLFIFLVLCICAIVLVSRQQMMERFYTLFTPYKYKSNMVKDYVRLSTSTDYNYNTLVFGIAYRHDYVAMYNFMVNLIKTVIANSPILKFDMMRYTQDKEVCLAVMNKDVNMGIVSEPMLIDAITGFNTVFSPKLSFDNLRFIANIGNQYVYLLIRKDSKINSMYELKGKKVSIGMKDTNVWKVSTDLVNFMNMKTGTDLITYEMHHKESLFALLNNQLDAMFYTDYYPSQFITDVFTRHDPHGILTLLPLDDFRLDTFKLSYYYYEPTTIDLNKMPQTFLPTKTGSVYYTRFNPDFPTFSFKQIIISNRETDADTVYNFTKHYFENITQFKHNPVLNKNKDNLFQLSVDRSMLFIHRGAYKYYMEMGYVVDKETDKNCMYLVSKTVCNKKNLDVVKHSVIV